MKERKSREKEKQKQKKRGKTKNEKASQKTKNQEERHPANQKHTFFSRILAIFYYFCGYTR